MRGGAVILFLALAGCATVPVAAPKPAVQVVYQRVDVPIPTPCTTKAKIPAEPEKVAGKLTGDPRVDLDVVSASALRLRAWGQQLAAILSGCTSD